MKHNYSSITYATSNEDKNEEIALEYHLSLMQRFWRAAKQKFREFPATETQVWVLADNKWYKKSTHTIACFDKQYELFCIKEHMVKRNDELSR